jgi:hypothetical protein
MDLKNQNFARMLMDCMDCIVTIKELTIHRKTHVKYCTGYKFSKDLEYSTLTSSLIDPRKLLVNITQSVIKIFASNHQQTQKESIFLFEKNFKNIYS